MYDGWKFWFVFILFMIDIVMLWIAVYITLFVILTIAYKKYRLFANKHFVISIVSGGIIGITLGCLLGYILKWGIEYVKILHVIGFSSIYILSFFLVWCYICFLTYIAHKKQENKRAYKTRHFIVIISLFSIILFLSSLYSSYKL